MTHTIVFAGTPEFAVPSLKAVARWCDEHQAKLVVYTQPDRPKGRGRKLTASPIKQTALALGLQVLQPENFKDDAPLNELRAFKPGLMIVAAYGLLLPQALLDIPKHGCLNVHPSLLPRWRGAAPIQRAVEAGDIESGVSIMHMTAGLDAGPWLLQRSARIGAQETAGELHDRLSTLGAELLYACLAPWLAGESAVHAQYEPGVCYAHKITREDRPLDWQQSAVTLANKIRGFNPVPVATAKVGDEVFKIWLARALSQSSDKAPGTIVQASDEGIDVATGDGVLRITKLQRPGGKPLLAREFLQAHSLLEGTPFG